MVSDGPVGWRTPAPAGRSPARALTNGDRNVGRPSSRSRSRSSALSALSCSVITQRRGFGGGEVSELKARVTARTGLRSLRRLRRGFGRGRTGFMDGALLVDTEGRRYLVL